MEGDRIQSCHNSKYGLYDLVLYMLLHTIAGEPKSKVHTYSLLSKICKAVCPKLLCPSHTSKKSLHHHDCFQKNSLFLSLGTLHMKQPWTTDRFLQEPPECWDNTWQKVNELDPFHSVIQFNSIQFNSIQFNRKKKNNKFIAVHCNCYAHNHNDMAFESRIIQNVKIAISV